MSQGPGVDTRQFKLSYTKLLMVSPRTLWVPLRVVVGTEPPSVRRPETFLIYSYKTYVRTRTVADPQYLLYTFYITGKEFFTH